MPHTPLWAQKLSTDTTYTLYTSSTLVNQEQEPTLGSPSNLCLSCHDGTVAPGQSVPYGKVQTTGTMASQDLIVGTLQGVHPFNLKLPLNCTADNLLSSVCSGTTGNPAVKVKNNVQCTSCHDPHVQNLDPVAGNFLVMNNASSALCLACHVSQPSENFAAVRVGTANAAKDNAASSHGVGRPYNPFTLWRQSVHGTAAAYKVSKGANLGPYTNIQQNGCASCHTSHNAPGGQQLLNGPTPAIPNMDATTQNCITCHNGGSNISPAIPNVYAEFAKTGHPFPAGSNKHVANESLVLTNNRHATCVDCHEPHASQQTGSFASTTIRLSQNGVAGVSGTDGTTSVSPAINQYETCLRCHGTSPGKQAQLAFGYLPTRIASAGDPLNLIPQFGVTVKSSHPVMHDSDSSLAQPSLLKFMWNLDGHTQGRAITARILCTDCHNSDDNREFGGPGPNGPHGSKFAHILERRYEFSQVAPGLPPVAGPGSTIQNLLPVVLDPAAGGPYSLCAKCHDLSNIVSSASTFAQHGPHINAGFSCSVCHTAHGTSANSSNVTGERMVNFDLGVVARNDTSTAPVSYNHGSNTCTLKCHNYNHNSDGSVTAAIGAAPKSVGAAKH
jgi:predicted CXXCH cytochrome family protein